MRENEKIGKTIIEIPTREEAWKKAEEHQAETSKFGLPHDLSLYEDKYECGKCAIWWIWKPEQKNKETK